MTSDAIALVAALITGAAILGYLGGRFDARDHR